MSARLAWGVFVVVAACAVAAGVQWLLRRSPYPRAPEFRLVERSGRPLTRRDLIGDVWVADFIFTRCAGSCPVMMNRMFRLHGDFPDVRYVSFSVDPEHDTPEVLSEYVRKMSLPEEWLFATGTYDQMQSLAKDGFKLSMAPGSDPKEPVIHSDRFVLVDRYGRIRASAPARDEEAMEGLRSKIREVLDEPFLPVQKLPAVNAALNAAAAVLLIVGYLLIRAKRVGAHRACMLGALAASTLFLVGYFTAHAYLGSTPFQGQGWIRTVYIAILLTHTVLAALIVPLAGITLVFAMRERFERHRAIARWTLPLWLYVSVTGVVIYFMLYGL